MKTSGSESLSATANIFLGQTEAPLVIKPYLQRMTLSELNAIMVGGFTTIAGGVMAAYVGLLKDSIPNIAGHLMSASIMCAPCRADDGQDNESRKRRYPKPPAEVNCRLKRFIATVSTPPRAGPAMVYIWRSMWPQC